MGTIEVEILGVHEAYDLAASLERAGDGRLGRDLADALYDAHIGIGAELRASALATLPKRGGLAAAIATAHINVNKSNGMGSPRVTITAEHQYNVKGLDDGLDVHPLWGDKRHWYLQHVRSGWFTDPLKSHQHTTTESFLERAVARFTDGIG